ncbi:uncharacterized protein [Coffea arabica]|uniref:Uncharacterized protein isoform X3 n=1 Tax=Coffea arabica TaxID=13443 RepID=A0ABM4WTR7_COFAR
MEKVHLNSLVSPEVTSNIRGSPTMLELEGAIQRESQSLWATGKLAEPIPDGFYFITPERRFTEFYDSIPSLGELQYLDSEGFAPNVILVDTNKDKKLSMMKQLALTLVKGLSSSPTAMIKKIAGLGLPREGVMDRTDSYKHMSVTVFLDSVEFLVDLVRVPGKLAPCTSEAIFFSHMIASRESESALNSYDSPMEPCSPICGYTGQVDLECTELEEFLQPSYRSKLEASTSFSGPSMRGVLAQSKAIAERSLSHSDPNVTNSFWWLNQKNMIVEPNTATSSPDPYSFQGPGRSILGGRRYSFRDYCNDVTTSRSAGASPTEARRRRRQCISMVPEIGDDIVRAVRAMNEALKRNRFPKEYLYASSSCSRREKDDNSDLEETVSKLHPDHRGERVTGYNFHEKQMNSEKAISLPSSPRYFTHHASGRCEAKESIRGPDMISTMNKMLEIPKILNKKLFPFEEWNIEFSELTIQTRIGIGFFGEVFHGIWNGIQVAVKVFLEQDLTLENIEDFCTEISILSRVRHPNVILFLGACTKPPRLSMVTEYMEMGSLYYLIHVSGQKKKLSWRRRLKMLCDICRGLLCLHRMKIVHRDLKSANCLVNKHWTVKICDFGLSRVLMTTPMKDYSSAGTPEWMAPELIRNEPFTEKCDIFSFGVIIWELCTLNKPWHGVPSVQIVGLSQMNGLAVRIFFRTYLTMSPHCANCYISISFLEISMKWQDVHLRYCESGYFRLSVLLSFEGVNSSSNQTIYSVESFAEAKIDNCHSRN